MDACVRASAGGWVVRPRADAAEDCGEYRRNRSNGINVRRTLPGPRASQAAQARGPASGSVRIEEAVAVLALDCRRQGPAREQEALPASRRVPTIHPMPARSKWPAAGSAAGQRAFCDRCGGRCRSLRRPGHQQRQRSRNCCFSCWSRSARDPSLSLPRPVDGRVHGGARSSCRSLPTASSLMGRRPRPDRRGFRGAVTRRSAPVAPGASRMQTPEARDIYKELAAMPERQTMCGRIPMLAQVAVRGLIKVRPRHSGRRRRQHSPPDWDCAGPDDLTTPRRGADLPASEPHRCSIPTRSIVSHHPPEGVNAS